MDEWDDPPRELRCYHMILCHTMWHLPDDPDAGYSLGRVVVQVRPPGGDGYGFQLPRLFVYVQLLGTPGEYTFRVRQVPIGTDEDGDEVEGEPAEYGPWDVLVTNEEYVESLGLPLPKVSFPSPGVYEFQFWADGFDEPLAAERILAKE